MKKIVLFLGFLLLVSCGYQPIFSGKDSNFLLKRVIFDEDDKISLNIKNKLNYLTSIKNYNKIIELKIRSEKKINTSSKDSKGDTLMYKMTINTHLEVYSNNQVTKKKSISKNFIYKNIANKFDLKQYEKTIEETLINAINKEIILILYN